MRVGLIACCKEKLDHASPARELYCSPLFTLARGWMEHPGRCDEWAILSAKHGLVLPGDALEPYDLSLEALTEDERRAWAQRTRRQILERWGTGAIYLVVLGHLYHSAVWGLPLVEDVIAHWTQMRRDRGMSGREASVGIGVLMKYLRQGRGFGV